MKNLIQVIQNAQSDFNEVLVTLEATGGLTKEYYQNFLSMQYHLTKGVQKHMFAIAAHERLSNKSSLRKFLINFGIEEEPHYLLAERDLSALELEVLPINVETEIWWAFFNLKISEHPFLRLGGTCVLENIAATSNDLIRKLLSNAEFLTPRNTVFVAVHQHEELPHGDQVLEIVKESNLDKSEFFELVEGANIAKKLYIRMLKDALSDSKCKAPHAAA